MSKFIVLNELQPIDNTIHVSNIIGVSQFNGYYTILHRDPETGEARQLRKLKTGNLTKQFQDNNIAVSIS